MLKLIKAYMALLDPDKVCVLVSKLQLQIQKGKFIGAHLKTVIGP